MATYGTTNRSPLNPASSRTGGKATPARSAPARTSAKPLTFGGRIIGVMIVLALLYAALAARLFFLQILRHDDFQRQANKMRERSLPILPRRGVLLDRNGATLVTNETAADVIVDPNLWFVKNNPNPAANDTPQARRQEVVSKLSALLPGVDVEAKIAAREAERGASGRYRTITIAQTVPLEVGKQIMAARLAGVSALPATRRTAIDGDLAPHIIGFTGKGGEGRDGLEHGLEPNLKGVPGVLAAEFDHQRRVIPGTVHTEIPVQNGRDVVLTIDSSLQHMVQETLGRAFAKHHAEAATAIVLDPKNGDILACANYPTYDLNQRGHAPAQARLNRAVSVPYEPGSTLKIITVAAALEEKAVTPATRFFCNGSHQIGKRTIHCHLDNAFPHGHGDEDLTDVIRNSCNVATANCAFRIGKEALYHYETAFGIGDRTGSGLPGESRGRLTPPDNWSDIQLSNIAFGQGVSVTPLQLAAAYAAIANDGVWMRPHIVWGERDPETQQRKPDKLDEGRRAVSPQTAQQLRDMLQAVVERGTGKNAQLDGYTSGGKTGTAQIAEHGSYQNRKFVASFIGMAPMKNPQFVILVAVTDPKDQHFGAEVSAPVFREIAEQALLARRVPHDKAPTPAGAKRGKGGAGRVALHDD